MVFSSVPFGEVCPDLGSGQLAGSNTGTLAFTFTFSSAKAKEIGIARNHVKELYI